MSMEPNTKLADVPASHRIINPTSSSEVNGVALVVGMAPDIPVKTAVAEQLVPRVALASESVRMS